MYKIEKKIVLCVAMAWLLGACGAPTSKLGEAPATVTPSPDISTTEPTYETLEAQKVTTHTIMTSQGLRYFKIYAPQANMQNQSMLLFLHGGGQSMAIIEPEVGGQSLRQIADQDNVMIVVPNGTDAVTGSFYSSEDDLGNLTAGQRWHDDTMEGLLPAVEAIDDVAFLTQLTVELQNKYGVNKKRTYVAGVSNGGFMAQKLVLESPGLFAAAAPGLALTPVTYQSRQVVDPVPMVFLVGSEDIQTINLGADSDFVSVEFLNPNNTMNYWASQQGSYSVVPRLQLTVPGRNGCFTTLDERDGDKPVFMFISQGGGHALPSQSFPTNNREQCKDFDGLQGMWSQMSQFTR